MKFLTLLSMAVVADPAFEVVDRGTPLPDGWRQVKVATANTFKQDIIDAKNGDGQNIIGYWSMVALVDGIMHGEGYGYRITKGLCGPECGEKLLSQEQMMTSSQPTCKAEGQSCSAWVSSDGTCCDGLTCYEETACIKNNGGSTLLQ